jgi:carboxypeptidase T
VRHGRWRLATTGQPAEVRTLPNALKLTMNVPASGKFEWHVNPSLRPSRYTDQFVDESYTLTCSAPDGTVLETTTVKVARGQLVNRSLCTQGGVGGTVPSTLALTPATFGAFTPGIAKEYDAAATATTVGTAGNALLSVADPSPTNTGKLVNGAFTLANPLRAAATSPAGSGSALAPVGGSAAPTSLLTYTGPVSNDPVTVAFKQAIGANDALRTGTYSTTLTFTLSTTNPWGATSAPITRRLRSAGGRSGTRPSGRKPDRDPRLR